MTRKTPTDTGAPEGLGHAGTALWESITTMQFDGDRLVLRPDELVVLATAARTADMVARLESEVGDGPLMIEGSKGQDVVHPAVVELRFQRAAVASLLRQLAIPEEDSWDNLTASQRARKAARARWSS